MSLLNGKFLNDVKARFRQPPSVADVDRYRFRYDQRLPIFVPAHASSWFNAEHSDLRFALVAWNAVCHAHSDGYYWMVSLVYKTVLNTLLLHWVRRYGQFAMKPLLVFQLDPSLAKRQRK